MNPNQSFHNYQTSDLHELNQKIQHRFIRDVVKPYSNSIKKSLNLPKNNYRIPKSSELLKEIPMNENFKSINNKTTINSLNNSDIISTYAPTMTPIPVQLNVPSKISCMDINMHINNCPICLKLYQPYNNVLMIIIVILILIILFFAKYCWKF